MTNQYMFNHGDIKKVLKEIESGLTPAEFHGMITAWLCAHDSSDERWFSQVLHHDHAPLELQALYEKTADQLADDEFILDLFLPDDDQPIDVRAKELSIWCHGFVSGLALAGIDLSKLDDIDEHLNYFVEISRLDYDGLEENETNEEMLLEISEFVRTLAMIIFVSTKQEESRESLKKKRNINKKILH